MNLTNLINDYLSYIKGDLRCSPHTYNRYAASLALFLKFTEDIALSALTDDILAFYRAEVAALPLDYQTKNLRLTPIRRLLKFCSEKKRLTVPDTHSLYLFENRNGKKPYTLPPKEKIEYFLQTTKNETEDLIVNLLYATGMRITELLSLTVGQVQEEFSIMGKRNKQRPAFCPKKHVHRVRAYEKGKIGKLFPMTASWVDKSFCVRGDRMGVKITPHTLRHAFITRKLEKGAPIEVVQKWAGHANITTTLRYTHLTNAHLAAEFKKYA